MLLNLLFSYLDRIQFLNINIWDFSYHSFFREYARLFLLKAVLAHPVKSLQGFKKYLNFIKNHENLFPKYNQLLSIPDEKTFLERIKREKIEPFVGLGFCLKPYHHDKSSSSCPSGRDNHDCLYLEKGQTRAICLNCAIFRISEQCLKVGCKVYIMTSARDIARDFLFPQINFRKFPSAILLLCPYSVQTIIPPLLMCKINMFLIAYDSGYCRDFREWLSADRGKKDETTTLNKASWEKLMGLLGKLDRSKHRFFRFQREGNIFSPTI